MTIGDPTIIPGIIHSYERVPEIIPGNIHVLRHMILNSCQAIYILRQRISKLYQAYTFLWHRQIMDSDFDFQRLSRFELNLWIFLPVREPKPLWFEETREHYNIDVFEEDCSRYKIRCGGVYDLGGARGSEQCVDESLLETQCCIPPPATKAFDGACTHITYSFPKPGW